MRHLTIRQQLVQLHTLAEIGRYTTLRQKAEKAAGRDIAGAGNIAKLAMSEIVRRSRVLYLNFEEGRRDGPLCPGTAHLRRHRSGAAQHHRRACPRPAERAEQRAHHGVARPAAQRLSRQAPSRPSIRLNERRAMASSSPSVG